MLVSSLLLLLPWMIVSSLLLLLPWMVVSSRLSVQQPSVLPVHLGEPVLAGTTWPGTL